MVSTGFDYTDISSSNPPIQTHVINPIQGFQSNSEVFNLTTGMEMIGFSKHLQPPSQPGPSSKMITDYYFTKSEFSTGVSENLMVGPAVDAAWQESRLLVNESSTFRCVFPGEGNERPSQGLSLSLSSTNPSGIGLQTFELKQADNNHPRQDGVRFDLPSNTRDGVYGKFPEAQQNQQMMQHGFEGKNINFYHLDQFQLKNSKYLGPSQELLKEFCSPGIKQNDLPIKNKHLKTNSCEEENGSSSTRIQSLRSLDFMELQRRKAKLFSLLEEVDKRYRHYRDQMKDVVSSFEAVAGNGSANVYSALASRTMSRHFRRLRDAIVDQIQVTKKAMGEKDQAVPGTTRGETPRLKILDQSFRQQRAFQQMSMMENHPWRPQRGLPERAVTILRAWLFEHFLHPYPTDVDKHILARQTGLSRSQVSNWFINARVRLWKPMVEEMYVEELKENENTTSSERTPDHEEGQLSRNPDEDLKPPQEHLVGRDSERLSCIISRPEKNKDKSSTSAVHNQSIGKVGETFGAVDLDFSSYNHHQGGAVSYNNRSVNHNFNGGGVSLTLGLQQHGGNGSAVNLDFSSASQSSLFYPRDHIEDCQQVQYSLMEGEAPSFPYRNLMGAQLLHDFVG